jgi:glycosyltransferase involved in cell wall biosynthesis
MLTEQRKKILFIVQLPPPVHGASIMNNYVVNSEKIKENFNSFVLNLHFLTSIKEITKFSFKKIIKAIYYGFELIWMIRSKKPDLVYLSFSPKGYSFYRDTFYVFLIKLYRKKVVIHLHGKGIKVSTGNSPIKKKLYQQLFKKLYVICLSEKLVHDIEDVYKSKPFIVPNGIEQLASTKDQITHDITNTPQILCLSNYMQDKGILDLIDALKILKNQGYTFNARLVGAPIDLATDFLQNQINSQNLSDCVEIIGSLYGNDKINELKKTDIFVFPSKNEAFPLVILEAMQFGLPIVSTLEGGIPEMVIDNETGFLIEKENPQLLADKLTILLKDKDLRIRLGERRFAENYTLEKFETKMVNTLNLILERSDLS